MAYAQIGYQQLTSIDSSTLLNSVAPGVPNGAAYAVVVPESQAVRWRNDGTAPTTTVGMPIAAGGSWIFEGRSELLALRFIGQVAGAKLNVVYYG